MKRSTLFMLALTVAGTLVACGTTGSNAGNDVQAPSKTSERIRLGDDYNGALSIQSQLAVGTLMLEGSELAVDETQAADLLTLWRALSSLSNSDTTAPMEIEAVLNQIQDTMTTEQVYAIAEMRLTDERLTTMLEDGELALGPSGFGTRRGENPDDGSQSGEPNRGFRGGEPGFGGFPGGDFQGGLDPEAIATRRAASAGNGSGTFQDRALTAAVIRLLETKTGEVSGNRPVRAFEVVFSVVSEATGLSPEEIRAQTAEGATLAQIVEANGADVEEVRASLIEALSELPNAADLDVEQLASQWLGLEP